MNKNKLFYNIDIPLSCFNFPTTGQGAGGGLWELMLSFVWLCHTNFRGTLSRLPALLPVPICQLSYGVEQCSESLASALVLSQTFCKWARAALMEGKYKKPIICWRPYWIVTVWKEPFTACDLPRGFLQKHHKSLWESFHLLETPVCFSRSPADCWVVFCQDWACFLN